MQQQQPILDPSLLEKYKEPTSTLTSIPWTLSVENNEKNESSVTATNTNDQDDNIHVGSRSSNLVSHEDASFFLNKSYLDIRRQQNLSFADDRLLEGVSLVHSNKLADATKCYLQGLDVAPNHADLLVAYGALLANQFHWEEALSKLEQALESDPCHANGQKYRMAVLEKIKTTEKTLKQRQSQSGQLAVGKEPKTVEGCADIKPVMAEPVNAFNKEEYSLLYSSSDNDSSSSQERKQRRKRKRKKRKKKEKKRKKREHS